MIQLKSLPFSVLGINHPGILNFAPFICHGILIKMIIIKKAMPLIAKKRQSGSQMFCKLGAA